jgi:hypothetical protein
MLDGNKDWSGFPEPPPGHRWRCLCPDCTGHPGRSLLPRLWLRRYPVQVTVIAVLGTVAVDTIVRWIV